MREKLKHILEITEGQPTHIIVPMLQTLIEEGKLDLLRNCNCANKGIDCLNCANEGHDEHCQLEK